MRDGGRQLFSPINGGNISLYLSNEAMVILGCGRTDVVVAAYFSGKAAMVLRCGRTDVVVVVYFSSKAAAGLMWL